MIATPTRRLGFELVPASSWYRNVRANVRPETWMRLQDHQFAVAAHRCEICAHVGPRHPVELHEVWSYHPARAIQRLERLIALCPRCHAVKHIGRLLAACRREALETAIEWYCSVNAVAPAAALLDLQDALARNAERSRIPWQLDVRLLRQYAVDLDGRGIERGHRPTALDY